MHDPACGSLREKPTPSPPGRLCRRSSSGQSRAIRSSLKRLRHGSHSVSAWRASSGKSTIPGTGEHRSCHRRNYPMSPLLLLPKKQPPRRKKKRRNDERRVFYPGFTTRSDIQSQAASSWAELWSYSVAFPVSASATPLVSSRKSDQHAAIPNGSSFGLMGAGICPGNHEGAGKRLRGKHARQSLVTMPVVQAAHSASHQ